MFSFILFSSINWKIVSKIIFTFYIYIEVVEPILPSPESQSAQFASRPVFIVGEVEEGRLSPAYWLALPGADDADQEQEQV